MTAKLLAHPDPVWSGAVDLGTKRGRRYAAIAFIGAEAPQLLSDWSRNDVLVCDASKNALKKGSTNPDALAEFIDRGVLVFSVERLHAKVLVGPTAAVVGSMNASANSSVALIEAAVRLEEPGEIAAVRAFVEGLRKIADEVDSTYVELARSFYRPPQGGPSAGRPTSTRAKHRLHIYSVTEQDPPAMVQRAVDAHDLKLPRRGHAGYYMDFVWDQQRWCRPDEWVVVVTQDGLAYPPAECWTVLPAAGRSTQQITYLRTPRNPAPKPWEKGVVAPLLRSGYRLKQDSAIRDLAKIAAVFKLWNKGMDLPLVYQSAESTP